MMEPPVEAPTGYMGKFGRALICRLTVAMSTRIPLGRFLKVGGKRENIAKLIVWPEAAAPSTVTVKRLVRALAEVDGVNVTETCFQVVWLPERVAVADANA